MTQPPLFDRAPPLACSRRVGEDGCGKEAKWHVIWNSDMDNGLACDQHQSEIKQKWVYYAIHPYQMECSMPGCVFVEAENRCIVDEEGLGLPTLKEVLAV